MERERKMEKYRRELPRDSPAAPATCAAGEPRAPVGRPRAREQGNAAPRGGSGRRSGRLARLPRSACQAASSPASLPPCRGRSPAAGPGTSSAPPAPLPPPRRLALRSPLPQEPPHPSPLPFGEEAATMLLSPPPTPTGGAGPAPKGGGGGGAGSGAAAARGRRRERPEAAARAPAAALREPGPAPQAGSRAGVRGALVPAPASLSCWAVPGKRDIAGNGHDPAKMKKSKTGHKRKGGGGK
nr:translation initiation factor IF-2-like [Taeniopygia guttata]